jgi:hypothetical protein
VSDKKKVSVREVYRDAKTGQYVTKDHAGRHPRTTIIEKSKPTARNTGVPAKIPGLIKPADTSKPDTKKK